MQAPSGAAQNGFPELDFEMALRTAVDLSDKN